MPLPPGKSAILIAGPTASGKSGLALRLARELSGTILNADSMQVYRDLGILTARPSTEEERETPHELYGFVPGADAYSAGRYVNDAALAIDKARAAGRVPIIVGGTGLYFKVLLEGLSPIPAIDANVRAHWRGEAERLGPAALHRVLAERDPVMAQRLLSSDPQRITRALEVIEATGRSLADWQQVPGHGILDAGSCVPLMIAPERAELYARCDLRFEAMLAQGALDEVAALHAIGLHPDLPIMRALGVRPLLAHLSGHTSLAEAAERVKAETRQYAKRQVTWLRSNMIAWKWLNSKDSESFGAKNIPFIDA